MPCLPNSLCYILEGHELNTDQPEKISPQLLSVFVLQDISQWKSCVLFFPVWAIVHTKGNRTAPTLAESEGPAVLANWILRLLVLSVRNICSADSSLNHTYINSCNNNPVRCSVSTVVTNTYTDEIHVVCQTYQCNGSVKNSVTSSTVCNFTLYACLIRDKWVPVTTAWRVLRLQMEERHPIWRVAGNILNKQPWRADKGWSYGLGVRQGANNSSL